MWLALLVPDGQTQPTVWGVGSYWALGPEWGERRMQVKVRWGSSAWSVSVPRDRGRGGWHSLTYGVMESRWNGSSVDPARVSLRGKRTW